MSMLLIFIGVFIVGIIINIFLWPKKDSINKLFGMFAGILAAAYIFEFIKEKQKEKSDF